MVQLQHIDDTQMAHLLQLAAKHPEVAGAGVALRDVRSAHVTNNYRQLEAALTRRLNMLEGDVRMDGRKNLVMAHGRADAGLSLQQWLAVAKASGRQVKIDFKELDAVWPAVDVIKQSGINEELLLLNVTCVNWPGLDRMSPSEVGRLQRLLPDARIALAINRVPYFAGSLEQAQAAAGAVGNAQRVTFPLQAEYITPDVVRRLAPYGSVSAWNHPAFFDPDDIEAERKRLVALGVNGMIDLRHRGADHGPELPAHVKPSLSDFKTAAVHALEEAAHKISELRPHREL